MCQKGRHPNTYLPEIIESEPSFPQYAGYKHLRVLRLGAGQMVPVLRPMVDNRIHDHMTGTLTVLAKAATAVTATPRLTG